MSNGYVSFYIYVWYTEQSESETQYDLFCEYWPEAMTL